MKADTKISGPNSGKDGVVIYCERSMFEISGVHFGDMEKVFYRSDHKKFNFFDVLKRLCLFLHTI